MLQVVRVSVSESGTSGHQHSTDLHTSPACKPSQASARCATFSAISHGIGNLIRQTADASSAGSRSKTFCTTNRCESVHDIAIHDGHSVHTHLNTLRPLAARKIIFVRQCVKCSVVIVLAVNSLTSSVFITRLITIVRN